MKFSKVLVLFALILSPTFIMAAEIIQCGCSTPAIDDEHSLQTYTWTAQDDCCRGLYVSSTARLEVFHSVGDDEPVIINPFIPIVHAQAACC